MVEFMRKKLTSRYEFGKENGKRGDDKTIDFFDFLGRNYNKKSLCFIVFVSRTFIGCLRKYCKQRKAHFSISARIQKERNDIHTLIQFS